MLVKLTIRLLKGLLIMFVLITDILSIVVTRWSEEPIAITINLISFQFKIVVSPSSTFNWHKKEI